MTNSALRRNVCQYLGIATAADIKAKRHITTTEEAARVTAWLDGCEFAWVECETPAEALVIETTLRGEFKPQMNRL